MNVLLVYKQARLEDLKIHDACLEYVKQVLKQKGFAYRACFRDDLSNSLFDVDLVVTVGGDGTVLDASHFVGSQPIFGVNSNPNSSVGSLCVADQSLLIERLDAYLAGKIIAQSVARIEVKLNGQKLEVCALNDILIANACPAAMTRYEIQVASKRATHKNSGLWISTACGSTGAAASAGGLVQKIEDSRLQWVCREPYFVAQPLPGLMTGFLKAGQTIQIRSLMQEGRIYIDGPHIDQVFREGMELDLTLARSHLNLIMTPEMELRRQNIGLLREQYEFERRHESAQL